MDGLAEYRLDTIPGTTNASTGDTVMNGGDTLDQHLTQWAGRDSQRVEIAATLSAIASVCRAISQLIGAGALAGALGATRGDHGAGDTQKELDVLANNMLVAGLSSAPVAALASEELDEPILLDPGAPLLVAVDPLDGSSNIDTNVSVGTIFSIVPAPAYGVPLDAAAFLQTGLQQLAAGYAIYGPQTAFVLTTGEGTHVFTLDRSTWQFRLTAQHVRVPTRTREFAINASNHRHWDEPIRIYVDDCLKGSEGPRGEDFNMRWIASMVAEAHRVLARGGIYMYPADLRDGYAQGRLRLIYEANPIAWLIEQAGGAASTGMARILELKPASIHQRVPLLFGSRDEVARLDRYHLDPYPLGERSPLFGRRGLFRS
jgi:fructose-1,6-bisphosphatase I